MNLTLSLAISFLHKRWMPSKFNKPYDKVLGAAWFTGLEIYLIA